MLYRGSQDLYELIQRFRTNSKQTNFLEENLTQ